MSKRLKNKTSVRPHVIPTTPLYNPMGGSGDPDSEFKDSDDKSYQKMFNEHTVKEKEKKERE